jgi:hypothetical protein
MLLLSLNTLAARQATADLARSALPAAPQRHEPNPPRRPTPKGPRRSRKAALGAAALFNIRPDAGQGRGLR